MFAYPWMWALLDRTGGNGIVYNTLDETNSAVAVDFAIARRHNHSSVEFEVGKER